MNSTRVAILIGLLAIGTPAAILTWDQTRTHPTPASTSIGYQPREGDLVFQSLPFHELTDMIEGATESPWSHCGVVCLNRGRWMVIEAIGPVKETPLEEWIRRGRSKRLLAMRPLAKYDAKIPSLIEACRSYSGQPYDFRYRLDDERIYCSELIYKAFEKATGFKLAELVAVRDLKWKPYEATIRKYEGGDPPLDRLMITPRDLAASSELVEVFAGDGSH